MDKDQLGRDAPITRMAEDRLGFAPLAKHLAKVFLHNDLSNGLVVGIEGEWGSGKSSLANLTLDMLEKEKNGPIIIRFSPWIVGHRSALLRELFLKFENAVSDMDPTERRAKLRSLLRQYARLAPALSAAADVSAVVVPAAGFLSRFINRTASGAAAVANPSLGALNKELRKHFEELGWPVLVFIDDLDRLEPSEAVEVLRLIRAVADFPNVAYLLAYDLQNLARCLETELRVVDGMAYIEKVVPASVKVPSARASDLRNWILYEIFSIMDQNENPNTGKRSKVEGERSKVRTAVTDWFPEYVSTPRDVVRIINALKLYVTPVLHNVDMGDVLFIQIIRLFHPELHDWIERYLPMKFLKTSTLDPESENKKARHIQTLESKLERTIKRHLEKSSMSNQDIFIEKISRYILTGFTVKEELDDPHELQIYDEENFGCYFLSLPN